MLIAHTAWAYYMGFPQRGEWTISHTLERLYLDKNYEATLLAWTINYFSPGHIRAVGK